MIGGVIFKFGHGENAVYKALGKKIQGTHN